MLVNEYVNIFFFITASFHLLVSDGLKELRICSCFEVNVLENLLGQPPFLIRFLFSEFLLVLICSFEQIRTGFTFAFINH